MGKGYLVSGIKGGKTRAKAFRTFNQAKKQNDVWKFQKGWRDLGISEYPSFDQAA